MSETAIINDLKMLVKMLAKNHPNKKLATDAIEYLCRKSLITPLDVLREVEPPETI